MGIVDDLKLAAEHNQKYEQLRRIQEKVHAKTTKNLQQKIKELKG